MNLWLNPTNTNGVGAGLCDSERSSAIVYMLRNGYYQSLCKVITSVVSSSFSRERFSADRDYSANRLHCLCHF